MKLQDLKDTQLATLIENRWKSSDTIWDTVKRTYDLNVSFYNNEPEWVQNLPRRQPRVRTGRIFINTEAVINSLIAEPPVPNILPGRDTPEAKEQAQLQEKYFIRRYQDLNVKEVLRKGLRNLYFSRLIVLKPFWDATINDFNVIAVDSRCVRIAKSSTKEDDSEFAIEEVTDTLLSVMRRFPSQAAVLMQMNGYTTEEDVMINNPDIKYKEAWIRDYVIFKYQNLILDKMPNPYWDWDGILLSEEEENSLQNADGAARRDILLKAKLEQPQRLQLQNAALQAGAQEAQDPNAPVPQQTPEVPPETDPLLTAAQLQGHEAATVGETGDLPLGTNQDTPQSYNAYYFNHFNHPRKPYILATAFNNENSPIGQTDMITQAIPLQIDADETKRNITRNARFMNGIWKIDSGVMGKSDAQRLDTEVGGVIWGKAVKDGATRETGTPLPAFVFENYQDDLEQIDNIMAASSAFKGQREGQETKGGRLALIDQSYLRLNEFVQVVDYVNYELFNWFYQLAKVRYTEHHYAKTLGKDNAVELISLMQDDFMDGTEVKVIAGTTLPEDSEFKYEQAQNDVKEGLISPIKYLEIAGYDSPQQTAKNALLFKVDPFDAVGITDAERAKIPPPLPATQLREMISFDDLPDAAKPQFLARMGITIQPTDVQSEGVDPIQIAFKDLPLDGQIQAAAKAGITLNPAVITTEAIAKHKASLPPPQIVAPPTAPIPNQQ